MGRPQNSTKTRSKLKLLAKYRNKVNLAKSKRWAFGLIVVFFLTAVIHPFIANEKPLYCKIDGQHYFPVTRSIANNLGLTKPYKNVDDFLWKEKSYDFKIMPVIPYSYNTLDKKNAGYKSPFAQQEIENLWQRHWLGTDILGRDTAAGILKGTEIAVKIGFFSVLLAALIAIVIGLGAAYTTRFPIRMDFFGATLLLVSAILVIYYIWYAFYVGISALVIPALFLFALYAVYVFWPEKYRIRLLQKSEFNIPFDSILMRVLEAMKSIPGLIFLLACISVFDSFSVSGLIFILAFLIWPGLTRYVRAEALKILGQDYITAAKAYGASRTRILTKHVLPKLFTSLSVVLAFAISATILVESTLSFLGIGIPIEQVSWGTMLREAKNNFPAWWLAVFPGIAMFGLILSLNILGEELDVQ